jgi:hypothetical protein
MSKVMDNPTAPPREVPLPNDKWLRSEKLSNWAVCLDPEDRFFGWKMYENADGEHWVSGAALTDDEARRLQSYPAATPHRERITELLTRRVLARSQERQS